MLHNGPLKKLTVRNENVVTGNTHLDVIRPQNDPATEAVAQIDDSHAAAEANHTGEGSSQCHDQDLWDAKR